ncbi:MULTISPECIES: DUF6572 domain-containing protein [Pseudomonas chlororaphis group]|uniref:DUF6572 domain-containing protein n=1 Tax=Pseudomonas chlororaphis group TaxID=136842 RepID=UPI002097CCB9|nr:MULTISPECIES: DUF6572 domain-containing protein [Pseudomonas chlororaphis group]MCO7580544.1 hypothetical protein [Pseudomonas protegens]MCO7586607.1 hypothetical protein [Pseudomonas chlororaphis]MCO7603610.1 hypothetical protein [Pseudomonas chlororaphis]
MSITNPQVIDIWAIPKSAPDSLLLIMVAPLEWADEAARSEHLLLLQEKINSYIAFIEGGQIYTEIPGAYGKYPIIQVVGLYELPEQAEYFMARVTETLNDVGIGFKFELRADERIRNM